MGQRDGLAVHLDRGRGKIGIIEHAEDLTESVKNASFLREQRLDLGGKHMRFAAQDAAQGIIIIGETRVGHQRPQGLVGQSRKFGGHERGGARHLHLQHLHP